jgi:tetratricopeptide (TPR) repeat protein
LNLLEWALEIRGSKIEDRGSTIAFLDPRSSIFDPRFRFAARGVGALLGPVLLVLAWPGWLQPAPYQPRGWTVEPDGSLVRLSRVVQQRHEQQKLRSDRFALTFSPESSHYLAWFCPAEKGFLDSRWSLFNEVSDDWVQMRRCLLDAGDSGPAAAELGPLLDRYHIDRIILHDPDWGRTTLAYRCLLLSNEWELLAVEGSTALFSRRESGSASPEPAYFRRAAYHPDADERAPAAAPRSPEPPGPFAPFYQSHDDRSPDRAEAALYLLSFDLAAQRMSPELGAQWLFAQATALVGTLTAEQGPVPSATAVAVRLSLLPSPIALSGGASSADSPGQQAAADLSTRFLALRDRGPPEALLLAIRAARRALAANPDDAAAFLLLGEAYLRMARQTREQSWSISLPRLAAIRLNQALTALHQAVRFRPELDEAHALLASIHYGGGQLDQALEHLRARLRIARKQAAQRGPDATAAEERLPALEADVERMEALVRTRLNVYEINADSLTGPSKVYERALLASRHGLTRKALDMLLASNVAIFGKDGLRLEVELLLQLGRAFEVRDWLEPGHETMLGNSTYHWLRAQAAAASGDYTAAGEELDQMGATLRHVRVTTELILPVRVSVAMRVGEAVIARPARGSGPGGLAGALFLQFNALRPLGAPAGLLRQEADLSVLRGLLALEAGEVSTARQHCRAALDVWGDETRAASGAGLDFPSRPIAQRVLHLLLEKNNE